MNQQVESMLAALDITDTHARTSEDIFTAINEVTPRGRIFGGQVLGQSVIAASRTTDPERRIHSMHGYFLRAGVIDLPTTLSVDRIYDGGSFSTRRVQAHQDGKPIFSMIASFQAPESGLDHQIDMPADLPQPEDVADSTAGVEYESGGRAHNLLRPRAFEMRHTPSSVFFDIEGARVPHQVFWIRARSPLPDDPLIHRAALAYATDFSPLDAVYRRHDLPRTSPGIHGASLDHAIWFHRDGRVDEWMCFVHESPSASGGRGLGVGRLYTRDGKLLATMAQEGLVRYRPVEVLAQP